MSTVKVRSCAFPFAFPMSPPFESLRQACGISAQGEQEKASQSTTGLFVASAHCRNLEGGFAHPAAEKPQGAKAGVVLPPAKRRTRRDHTALPSPFFEQLDAT
jgi:hypothetical protein